MVSGYCFKSPVSAVAPNLTVGSDGTGERNWGVISFPADNNQGRKFFMINQAGSIYMSLPSSVSSTTGAASSVIDAVAYGTSLSGTPTASSYLPWRR